jgi:hypothetical protein
MMWECPNGDEGDKKMVENGILPSTTEASMSNAITLVDALNEDG